jgi:hypothetical protein
MIVHPKFKMVVRLGSLPVAIFALAVVGAAEEAVMNVIEDDDQTGGVFRVGFDFALDGDFRSQFFE